MPGIGSDEVGRRRDLHGLADKTLHLDGYYKLPAPQTDVENCVAHNGSLIPVPGRNIMAQAWYQGGVSVFDFTDPAHAKEIAFFDRGPLDVNHLYIGGYWSTYWYNGHIDGSEIARGLDIFDAQAKSISLAERDRRGGTGEAHDVQPVGPAEVGVASELRRVSRLSRSARAYAGLGE